MVREAGPGETGPRQERSGEGPGLRTRKRTWCREQGRHGPAPGNGRVCALGVLDDRGAGRAQAQGVHRVTGREARGLGTGRAAARWPGRPGSRCRGRPPRLRPMPPRQPPLRRPPSPTASRPGRPRPRWPRQQPAPPRPPHPSAPSLARVPARPGPRPAARPRHRRERRGRRPRAPSPGPGPGRATTRSARQRPAWARARRPARGSRGPRARPARASRAAGRDSPRAGRALAVPAPAGPAPPTCRGPADRGRAR